MARTEHPTVEESLDHDIQQEMSEANWPDAGDIVSDGVSAPPNDPRNASSTPRCPVPPFSLAGSPTVDATSRIPSTSISIPQHNLKPSALPHPPTKAQHPHPLPLNTGSAHTRTYPVVMDNASGQSLPPLYFDWIRRFVDTEFTNENWGDEYMMPFGQQPKYMHCVDMLPDPRRAKDQNKIWKAMVDEGKKVNNGEKRKEDRKNSGSAARSFVQHCCQQRILVRCSPARWGNQLTMSFKHLLKPGLEELMFIAELEIGRLSGIESGWCGSYSEIRRSDGYV